MSRRAYPEGTEIQRNGYVYVKHGRFWFPKGREEYEKHSGSIPMGHVVTYLDGDRSNCDPSNLLCVSRAQLVAVNRNFKRGSSPQMTRIQFMWCDLNSKVQKARVS